MTDSGPTKRRVLIADDAPDMLELTTRIVAGMGFDVVAARDGEEALAKARSARPDLIILDIMMPKMHGIDVLKAVVAESPVGVIMASAKSFKPDVDQAIKLGAFRFISKPFEERDLVDAVERFFAQRSAARATPPTAAAAADAYAPSLDLSGGYWKLWGTRGSIPVVGARFARPGGHTACLATLRAQELLL